MFHLFTGNKLEILAEKYRQQLFDQPVQDPMGDEIVVVQTQGMAAYLKQYLAMHSGIAANLQMPFPKNFCERLIRQLFPAFEQAQQEYSGIALAAHIYMILQHNPARYPELKRYIDGALPELRRWQLAVKVAELFDNYQVYRYDDEMRQGLYGWQRRILGDLASRTGCRSRDGFYRDFMKSAALPRLPERVTVFGAGVLPPLYLDIFFKIAENTDVLFFYLSPCQEFWEDAYRHRGEKPEELNDENIGNYHPLLSSWGEAGRQLFSLLLSRQDPSPYLEFDEFTSFIDPENPTILQQVQESILHFDPEPENLPVDAADDSLEIHNCHSPRREIEVLHDKLIAKIKSGAAAPRDIIVMAPDINDYVQHINSVFGAGPLRECYTIADRTLRRHSGVAKALEMLLKLRRSTLSSKDVLELLALPVVGNARGIGSEEVSVISEWITSAGICWGVDGEDRLRSCEVFFEEYSWFPALDRMLTHFIAGKSEAELEIDGPCPLHEEHLALFGTFRVFLEELCRLRESLARQQTLKEWREVLNWLFERFFAVKDAEELNDFAAIRQFVDTHFSAAERSGLTVPVPVEVVEDILAGFLTLPGERFSFLRGGITFCSLTPLRNIPAKIVVVTGLNCRAFPRRDRSVGFNLMTENRRSGDRSSARDDRYLFLEALLSARGAFWLFYNGRSRLDNLKLYPSPLLTELAGYVKKRFGIEEIKQPMQPFDPRYFSEAEPGLISFSRENYLAAGSLCRSGGSASGTVSLFRPLPEKVELPATVALEKLIEWAKDPAAFQLKQSLGVTLFNKNSIDGFSTEEPFALNNLQKYMLRQKIFNLRLLRQERECNYRNLYCANQLPVGINGRNYFEEVSDAMEKMDENLIAECMAQQPYPAIFSVAAVEISGMLHANRELSSQMIVKFSSCKHKFYVEALLRHWALLQVSEAPQVTTRLLCIDDESGRGKSVIFRDFPDRDGNGERWRQLLDMYAASNQRLPFLLPGTLFKMGDDETLPDETIRQLALREFLGSEESAWNPGGHEPAALSRFFAPEIFEDERVIAELHALCDFFYHNVNSCGGGE